MSYSIDLLSLAFLHTLENSLFVDTLAHPTSWRGCVRLNFITGQRGVDNCAIGAIKRGRQWTIYNIRITSNGRLIPNDPEIFRRIMADCVKQFRGSLPLKGIGPFTHLDESMSSWDPLIFPLNGLNLCNGKVLFISPERNWVTSCVNSFIEIFMKGFAHAYLIRVTCCLVG